MFRKKWMDKVNVIICAADDTKIEFAFMRCTAFRAQMCVNIERANLQLLSHAQRNFFALIQFLLLIYNSAQAHERDPLPYQQKCTNNKRDNEINK